MLNSFACSVYEELAMEPTNKAKWTDLFWLLIPIMGFLVFCEVISSRNVSDHL